MAPMDNKLEVLTRKLYEEGIGKAEAEARKILEKAKQDADLERERANHQAAAIIARATDEAASIRKRTQSELQMMATQARQKVRLEIEQLIRTKAVDEPLREAMKKPELIQDAVLMILDAMQLDASDTVHIQVTPEVQEAIGQALKARIAAVLETEPLVNPDHRLKSGFQISREGSQYKLSFSEEDFKTYLYQFLSPEFQELLGGE
jgi:V/A-type H+-transporting ATPase subunit E